MLKEHIENNDVIRLISHNDADGISAAAVIANALKEEGAQFHTTIVPRLKDDVVNERMIENEGKIYKFVCSLNNFDHKIIQ